MSEDRLILPDKIAATVCFEGRTGVAEIATVAASGNDMENRVPQNNTIPSKNLEASEASIGRCMDWGFKDTVAPERQRDCSRCCAMQPRRVESHPFSA